MWRMWTAVSTHMDLRLCSAEVYSNAFNSFNKPN